MALDVIARREGYQPGTSNPARIRGSVGGVGYNIYSRLTSPRRLITAVGDDLIGSMVREKIADDPGIVVLPTALPTSVYLALMARGELLYGAADMDGIRRSLNVDAVSRELAEARDDDLVVLEANLSPALTAALLVSPSRTYGIVFECVSVEKARDHTPELRNLRLLSGTAGEIAAVSGTTDTRRLTSYMRKRKIEAVIQTRGTDGVALTLAHRHTEIAPPRHVDCADTTGAGDALVAGVVDALARGEDITGAIPGAMEGVVEYLEERR